MTKNIQIDPLKESQLSVVLEFVKQYHEFEGIEMKSQKREDAIVQLMRDASLGGVWMITGQGKPLGYIALCKGFSIEFGGFDGFIDEFYITAPHRGKGIGTRVLELIKEEAKTRNIQALHLEVAKSNSPAKKLYSRLGFETREKYCLMSLQF